MFRHAAVNENHDKMGRAVSSEGYGKREDDAPVVRASDARYPDMVRGSNQRWVGTPREVIVATAADQVVATVNKAMKDGTRLSVRSGGHCYEDFVYNPTVHTVIDVSEMQEVRYDPQRNALAVGPGASNFTIAEKLYRLWGIAIPGGSCLSVCAGGHICGGGYGLLSRKHGLTVDYLYGVEVVTVNADRQPQVVLATREPDDPYRDLWWAHTGGGGGNFGVVTRYLLKAPGATGTDPAKFLPQPPAEVFISTIAVDWDRLDKEDRFARLLNNWGAWHEHNSAPSSPYAGLFGLLKLNTKANGQIALLTQSDATQPHAKKLLNDYLHAIFAGVDAPLRPMLTRAGEHPPMPQFFEPQKWPWLNATYQLSGSSWAFRGDYKSAYLRKAMPADQITATHKWLTTPIYQNPNALVQIDSYGCQINTVPPAVTAMAQRDSILKLQYQTYWQDPNEDDIHTAWLRDYYRDVYKATGGVPVPNEVNDGCYINYPDSDLSDPDFNKSGVPWHTLYYKENYPKLQQIKKTYDPHNIFQHTQSIEPAP